MVTTNENIFAACCTSLRPGNSHSPSPGSQPPPELQRFFAINPISALNNIHRINRLLRAPYVIQVFRAIESAYAPRCGYFLVRAIDLSLRPQTPDQIARLNPTMGGVKGRLIRA